MQLEKHQAARKSAKINLSTVIRNNRGMLGSFDQRMASSTGDGPAIG